MTPETRAALRDIVQLLADTTKPVTGPLSSLHETHARAIGMLAGLGDTRHEAPSTDAATLVREFHLAMGAPVADKPQALDLARTRLRLSLILEEVGELAEALGSDGHVTLGIRGAQNLLTDDQFNKPTSIIEAADALADIEYVTAGTAVEMGIPLGRVLAEVHRSNLTKKGGTQRADGKIMKSASYQPPRIAEILGLGEAPPFEYPEACPATPCDRPLGHDGSHFAVDHDRSTREWTNSGEAINDAFASVETEPALMFLGQPVRVGDTGPYDAVSLAIPASLADRVKEWSEMDSPMFRAFLDPKGRGVPTLAAEAPRYVVKTAAEMVAGQRCAPFFAAPDAHELLVRAEDFTWKPWNGRTITGKLPASAAIVDTLDPVPGAPAEVVELLERETGEPPRPLHRRPRRGDDPDRDPAREGRRARPGRRGPRRRRGAGVRAERGKGGSMTRPVVLLDIDGVIANFIEANLRLFRCWGLECAHDDVTAYDFDGIELEPWQRTAMKTAWSQPGFCAAIPPYEGAREGVDRLREVADVYAVTAPMWSSVTWQGERMEWLVGHFGFDRKHVVSTHAKHLVRGDVLVEDKVSMLVAWQEAHPAATGVLMSRRYNDGKGWTGARVERLATLAERLERGAGQWEAK